MRQTCALLFSVIASLCAVAQTATSTADVVARIGDATVLILSGEGAGRLNGISTGVIVRPNGVILTAYHSIKDAREVQVRLRNGEVFDNVVLIGSDERRDVAALKITARDLPTLRLGTASEIRAGEPAIVVSNSNGLSWSASTGVFSAFRMADEVPGAGQGYRVLQFTAQVSGGASGAPLVDSHGALVGIITRGFPSGAGFAVPTEAVIGLADGTQNLAFGNGSALQTPTNRPSPSSAALASANPEQLLRSAKTLHVASRSMYFTPETLEKGLANQKEFARLGFMLVKDSRLADLLISIDRPLFTYTFTYSVMDSKTSLILDTGKVTAVDGGAAAGKIAKQLVDKWARVRSTKDAAQAK